MKEDMTYNEICQIKYYINQFNETLTKFAEQNELIIQQSSFDFFAFISKHILFYKYMYQNNSIGRYYKVLISDCYYYIITIIKDEVRYMYVNERSIIENYLRLIVNKSVDESHITDKIFHEIKEQQHFFRITDDEYSLLKSEYSESCGYIHGGNVLDNNLSVVFNECILNDKKVSEKNKYYQRIKKMIKTLDHMLVLQYKEDVSGAFHRRKSLLSYLIGEECVDLLFENR